MLRKIWPVGLGIALVSMWMFFNHFNTHEYTLYKVISIENWNLSKLQNRLVLPPMDKSFIHLSTKKQLSGIIDKFWKNEPEFIMLTINAKQLPGKLVLEANPGGSNKYYHLYNGLIPINSVISISKVLKQSTRARNEIK